MVAVFEQFIDKFRRRNRDEEDPKLNTQFVVTLRSLYLKLEAKRQREFRQSPESSRWDETEIIKGDRATQRINELLEGPESWASSYEIELLLLYLFDDSAIEVELGRCLKEAEQKLPASIYENYREAARDATVETKRALLGRLVQDLQWYQTTTYKILSYKREATRYISVLFVIAFLSFLGVMYIADRAVIQPESRLVMGIVITTGFWGAMFSMLLSLRKRLEDATLDELKVMRQLVYQLARSMIGVGAAAILFFFMQTGILSTFVSPGLLPDLDSTLTESQKTRLESSVEGIVMSEAAAVQKSDDPVIQQRTKWVIKEVKTDIEAIGFRPNTMLQHEIGALVKLLLGTSEVCDQQAEFSTELSPHCRVESRLTKELEELVAHERALNPRSLALLIMWSFLAGFSEKLVPNLLAKTEENVAEGQSSIDD